MNKKDLVMLIMAKKTLDYEKDPDPENWRTIKGAHVHVDNEGKIDGGAGGKFNGKGALPRSMFSGTGKQTEFAEVTEKKKEIAERVQKEKETQKAERRKQQAAARKQQKAEQEAKQRKEREDWYWEDKPESKPTAKGSAAQNLIDYIKEQTNIDLSQHRNTEREKRGQLLVNWKELDRNQQFAIQTLAQKGKFELIDNGGYGYILKPTKEPKLGATKPPKKKIDPASTEAQAKRQAIADDMMKRPFVSGKVAEASKKLIEEANKDYGGDHETSVMLENVVKDKDGAYVTLKIVAKDKTGKSRFPQSHSMTFKVGDLTKEQKKLYFSK